MNDPNDIPDTAKPEKTADGDHSAVDAYRKKLDSITEVTLPLTRALNKRIERARRAMGHPPKITGDEDTTDPDLEIEYALELEEEDDEEKA